MRKLIKILKRKLPSFHSECFYEFEITNNEIPVLSKSFEFEMKLADSKAIDQLVGFKNLNVLALKKRLRNGHSECFISYFDQAPIAYHWVQYSGSHFIRPIGKHLNLENQNSMAVIYHTRVAKVMQGRGVNSMVMLEILKHCRNKSIHRVLIYTSSKNIAQIKSLSKLGFDFIKSISSVKIGSRYFSLNTF